MTLVTLPVETPASSAMSFRTSRCSWFVNFDETTVAERFWATKDRTRGEARARNHLEYGPGLRVASRTHVTRTLR